MDSMGNRSKGLPRAILAKRTHIAASRLLPLYLRPLGIQAKSRVISTQQHRRVVDLHRLVYDLSQCRPKSQPPDTDHLLATLQRCYTMVQRHLHHAKRQPDKRTMRLQLLTAELLMRTDHGLQESDGVYTIV